MFWSKWGRCLGVFAIGIALVGCGEDNQQPFQIPMTSELKGYWMQTWEFVGGSGETVGSRGQILALGYDYKYEIIGGYGGVQEQGNWTYQSSNVSGTQITLKRSSNSFDNRVLSVKSYDESTGEMELLLDERSNVEIRHRYKRISKAQYEERKGTP